jgi:hypothetical protein
VTTPGNHDEVEDDDPIPPELVAQMREIGQALRAQQRRQYDEALDLLEGLAFDEDARADFLDTYPRDVLDLADVCSRIYAMAQPLVDWAYSVWPDDAALAAARAAREIRQLEI